MRVKMREHKGKRSNAGFTMTELIVVIALLFMISGGVIFGITRWIEWTKFTKQNEYARTLYLAAQNQLTQYSESGQIKALLEEIEDKNSSAAVLNVTKLTDEAGEAYDLEKLWPSSQGKGSNANRYRSEIYSIVGTPQDYQKYTEGKLADKSICAMYDLFSTYLYDMSILEQVVCLEFTPADAQVFAVLYSDQQGESGSFTYENTNDRRGTVSICNRQESFRKKRMVGYYGVDTLSKATSTQVEKPSIVDVRLNNEDTLNLTWRLGRVKEATQELVYEITVNDRETKKELFSFKLEGQKIGNQNHKMAVDCKVTRYVYDKNDKISSQDMGIYNMLTWIDETQTLHLVLDGADLDATASLYENVYPSLMGTPSELDLQIKEMKNTMSYLRFGVKTGDIYCSIEGSADGYKTTAKKQSNSENACFASMQEDTSEDQTENTYGISNMRHLYNVRYLEDTAAIVNADTVNTYQISSDMDWEAFKANEALFEKGAELVSGNLLAKNPITEKSQAFPSMKQLRAASVMEGTGKRKIYTIRGLNITEEENEKRSLYKARESTKRTGLVLVNYGTMQNFAMDAVTVTGEQNVAAFCGENKGSLESLTLKNTDNKTVITGNNCVGGITGILQTEDGKAPGQMKDLVNYGTVTGVNYKQNDKMVTAKNIGGIAGRVKCQSTTDVLKIDGCKNYGKVDAEDENAESIGGIAGNCTTEQKEKIFLTNCISAPQYTESEVQQILSSRESLKEKLKGRFVGGIVGYNDGASIVLCNTEEGYLFGKLYVGGIVGYNASQKEPVLVGAQDGERGINALHVLGESYVGGIVGCNPGNGQISGWENRAFVGAIDKYAGGITGYNGISEDAQVSEQDKKAKIIGCSSEVPSSAAVLKLSKSGMFDADYVGGIAGYNDGDIISEKQLSLVCNVTGNNFVGGIVGYNDVDAELSNYGIGSGYISGKGSFVGGIAGFNSSMLLLMELDSTNTYIPRYLESNPNQVSGKSCVGGTIGGNIVPAQTNILSGFLTDNFLGNLEATYAVAGGFMGYNELVSENVTKKMLQNAVAQGAQILENKTELEEYVIPLQLNLEKSKYHITISGKDEHTTQTKFGGIKAGIYVGGVMGYSEKNTALTIQNVENKTPVTALASVVNEEEQPKKTDYNDLDFTYSYAGGLIGKVQEKVTIINCKNRDAGDVISQGTYTGGLCEINEGLIKECEVSSVGTSDKDYIGGITGINEPTGRIEACIMNKKTITGKNYVGGIAAENYGTIQNTSVKEGTIRSLGEQGNIGGIAGINYEGSTIELKSVVDITVQAEGDYVGGIIGRNMGTLVQENKDQISVQGSVTGNRIVGGIVGIYEQGKLQNFFNKAVVTAVNGEAGGIAGISHVSISNCSNQGMVTAQKKGNAGGIVAVNESSISECVNTAAVSAQNGICGGICGVNGQEDNDGEPTEQVKKAVIRNCQTKPGSGKLTFESKTKAGGICGLNNGVISDSDAEGLVIKNLSSSAESMLGGITGENKGTISNCTAGKQERPITIESQTSKAEMGGVTGVNSGVIKGKEAEYTPVYADLSFVINDMAYFGNMGGIAGRNENKILYYAFSGIIEGTSNNPQNAPQYNPNRDYETNGSIIYGYGGIAGVNGNSQEKSQALIQNCKISSAWITGLGDAANVANIGGVAGVNSLGAVIRQISFGTEKEKTIKDFINNATNGKLIQTADSGNVYVGTGKSTTAYAHTGGVAGLNSGLIEEIGVKEETKDGETVYDYTEEIDASKVMVINYRGHVGGIIGYNRKTGIVKKTATGKDWKVWARANAQDNGCGGIIGYQAGEIGPTWCINRAYAEKTVGGSNTVGGIIGRMECATSDSYTISHCTNYGKLYSTMRTGGIVATWKYYGGTIEDCINYGELQSTGNAVGGIVGDFYAVTTEVRLRRCENHGRIYGANVCGGIAGYSEGANVLLKMQECVNTGLVRNVPSSGGLLGLSGGYNANSTIVKCTNYGFAENSTDFSGMTSKNISVIIQDSFGMANVTYPIAAKANQALSARNYYLTSTGLDSIGAYYDASGKKTDAPPEKFYIKSIREYASKGSTNSPEYLYKLVAAPDNVMNTDTSRAYFSYAGEGRYIYDFVFSKAMDLSQIDLYWFRSTDIRRSDYKVYYTERTDLANLSDNELRPYDEVNNCSDASFTGANPESVTNKEGGTVNARAIRIVVTKSLNKNNANANIALMRAIFHGTSGTENYEDGFYQFDQGTKYAVVSGLSGLKINIMTGSGSNDFTGLPYETLMMQSAGGGTVQAIGNPAQIVKREDGTYEMQLSTGEVLGISGLPMNPLIEFSGVDAKKDTSLKVQGAAEDNIRYRVFLADQPYLTTDKKLTETSKLSKPSDLKWAQDSYTASWRAVTNASEYQYEVRYYADADKKQQIGETDTYTTYNMSAQVPVNDINGIPVKVVEIRVRAGAQVLGADKTVKRIWSDYTDWVEKEVNTILPIPEYHFEMVIRNDGTMTYIPFLDNRETYVEFLKNLTPDLTEDQLNEQLKKLQISAKVSNIEFKFTVYDGKYTGTATKYNGVNGTGNQNFAAYAFADKSLGVANSQKVLRESQIPSEEAYTGNKFANVYLTVKDNPPVKDVGFHGETTDTLSYLLRIRYAISVIQYMHSEMLAVDKELGVPVSVSNSDLRVSDTTTDAIPTSLNQLPSDLLDTEKYTDLQVRSYTAGMSNNVVYNGHEPKLPEKLLAGKGVAKESLKKLYVTSDNSISEDAEGNVPLITEGKLAKGFVVQLENDGTYTLYYNALLDYNERQNYEYTPSDKTQMKTQVYYLMLSEEINICETPVILVNAEKDKDGIYADGSLDADKMYITWDLKQLGYENKEGTFNYKKDTVYDYSVEGTMSDGTVIQIQSGVYVTGADGENEIVLDTTSWNYKKIKICVNRRGESDSNGLTVKFPTGAVKEFPMKISLSQIAKPIVALHKDENGIVQKNTLRYDVTWNHISSTLPEERQATAGFEIKVVRAEENDEAAVKTYDSEEEFQKALENLQAFYGAKPGVEQTGSIEEGKLVYSWSEGTTEKKTMELILETEEGYRITENLTSIWTVEISDSNQNTYSSVIDLNDYERGEVLDISVRALAKADQTEYRNGIEGVISEMTLPSRLDVPDVSELVPETVYSEDSFITLEELAQGLNFNYQPKAVSSSVPGRYQMAVAIYDNCPVNTDTAKVLNSGDQEDDGTGYWNSGALETLIGKADAVEMNGNLLSASYCLQNVSMEYAGKWMKIAMRSISDSNVSSYWSDEDETIENTQNYMWIQIPRVQIETPSWKQSSTILYYDEDDDYVGGESSGDVDLAVTQTRLSFQEVPSADGYQIQIIQTGTADREISETAEYTIHYVNWIYLEKKEDGNYNIFYASSNPSFDAMELGKNATAQIPDCGQNPNAVYIGTTDTKEQVLLPYKGNVEESISKLLRTVSFIERSEDGATIELQLPDGEKVENNLVDEKYKTSAQIAVQSWVKAEKKDCYQDSQILNWYRRGNGLYGSAEYADYAEAPQGIALYPSNSQREGIAYEISAKARNWLVYQISFTGVSGTLYEGYVSSYGTGISDIYTVALLEKSLYGEDGVTSAKIRVAAIHDATETDGCLGKWSEWKTLTWDEMDHGAGTGSASQGEITIRDEEGSDGELLPGEQLLPGKSDDSISIIEGKTGTDEKIAIEKNK